MDLYRNWVSPILDRLDSETMHNAAKDALRFAESTPLTRSILAALAGQLPRIASAKLRTAIAGIELENPLLVAAGWDKHARSVLGLWTIGFAGVEIGIVTQFPQPGNPKPRQFVIGPGVAINRLGFNSPGMDVVSHHIERYCDSGVVIGVNIGRNKNITNEEAPRSYAAMAKKLAPYGRYLVINLSSPNTPDLRKLQDKPMLLEVVHAVNEALDEAKIQRPVFVKIAPDMTNDLVSDVIDVVRETKLAGIIAVNTSVNGDLKAKYGEKWRNEAGGFSGDDDDYRRVASDKVRHIYRETGGSMEIIGVGGICSAATALERIRSGAKAVQVMTGIRGQGLRVATNILRGMLTWMEKEGVNSISEIVGKDVR